MYYLLNLYYCRPEVASDSDFEEPQVTMSVGRGRGRGRGRPRGSGRGRGGGGRGRGRGRATSGDDHLEDGGTLFDVVRIGKTALGVRIIIPNLLIPF